MAWSKKSDRKHHPVSEGHYIILIIVKKSIKKHNADSAANTKIMMAASFEKRNNLSIIVNVSVKIPNKQHLYPVSCNL